MKIINIPTGGLCNRMRSIATAIAIAQKYDCPISIKWNNNNGLKANFNDLFENISIPNVKVIENKKWLYNIKGTKDYLLRKYYYKLKYEQVLFNYSHERYGDIYPHLKKRYSKDLLLISCYHMCKDYSMQGLFRPKEELQKRIDEVISSFSEHTIGVHIRRTDNIASITSSPIEVFIDLIQKEIKKNEEVKFYLASDDKSVKQSLTEKFPNRIITFMDDTDRDSLNGMKFAVVDLFCLSKTKKIIGSVASSYSETAAELGGIKLEYARDYSKTNK